MLLTEKEYEKLKSFAYRKGLGYKLLKPDCEDALHSALLLIQEQDVPKEEWKAKIHNQLRSQSRRNKREMSRRAYIDPEYLCN